MKGKLECIESCEYIQMQYGGSLPAPGWRCLQYCFAMNRIWPVKSLNVGSRCFSVAQCLLAIGLRDRLDQECDCTFGELAKVSRPDRGPPRSMGRPQVDCLGAHDRERHG